MRDFVKMGYNYYLIDHGISKQDIAKVLASLIAVEKNSYCEKTLYQPTGQGFEIRFVEASYEDVRPPTKEEKENEELRSAKSMESYYRGKCEELECDLKLLKREEEGRKEAQDARSS